MKKGKQLTSVFLALSLCVACSAGNTSENTESSVSQVESTSAAESKEASVTESKYTPGSYTATAKGFGGDVVVRLEVDEQSITAVDITGDNETAEIGGAALATLAQQVQEANSDQIDGVSGATVTSEAVRSAVKDCLSQASGVSADVLKAADGTYTGKAMGFMGEIAVDVTMKDNTISDIQISSINDTGMIGGAAAPQLCSAIVEHQSLAVDCVTGATVTSNGVLAAVADAIDQSGASSADYKKVAVTLREPQTTVLDTQVVVIGAGIAGLTAAIEAAEAGVDVIVLEKQGVYGGSTTRSEGFVMGAGTSYQIEQNIQDSAEDMYKDMFACYADEPTLDTELLRLTVDSSADLIDWLIDHGVVFEKLEAISAIEPRNDQRSHVSWKAGDGLMEKMAEAAEANDHITILMETPAVEILQKDGTVAGVKATNQYGDDITINADATILCAGSYGANKELVDRLNSTLVPISYTGCGDGDGWTLAENVGADMIDIGYMAGTFMYFPYGQWNGEATLPGSPTKAYFNVLQTNSQGKRLVNEDAFTFDFGDPLYDSGDTYGWAIVGKSFSEEHPDLYEEGQDDTYTINGVDYKLAYTADTIEDLAQQTNMDAQILKAAIERYNASCDAGTDDEFGKDPQYMERLDAPYTAYMLTPVVSDGYSGCRIDKKAQVLSAASGEPIPGFYAAGACALPQIIGNRYYGCGSLIMTCGVFGRIAGSTAAEQIKEAN